VKSGSGTLTLSGANTGAGTTIIIAGTLSVTGNLPGPVVANSGGTLAGTGTATLNVTVNAGATLAPGVAGPGSLTLGPLMLAGTLAQQITGIASFDKVSVIGPVTLNNATLALSGGYVPVLGNTFTIIDNDGADPVVGTFAGLPEGATIPFNGQALRISYVGGTGNDVTLTAINPAVTTFSGPSATGTGTVTASFTGGGAACTFTLSQLIPVTGHAASPPGPAPADFPHGLFNFTLGSCTPGSTITMTMTYPAALAAGTQYWKYGPTAANPAGQWYVLPATIAGNTVVFTITDGGVGDDDLAANGTIVDQGGPGNPGPPGSPNAIPTLSEWMLALLALLLLASAAARRYPKASRR
jgi:autotransporter-associated beta strand protein